MAWRLDAPDSGHAHAIVHQVAFAKRMGTANPRRRMPQQRFPSALESEYAAKIVGLLDRAKKAYGELLKQLPALLARAEEQRSDRMDASDELAIAPVSFAGFDIVIENPVGSTRSWIDSDGTVGRTIMRYAYGYIANTLGSDGEPVDVYLGPDESAPWVYVVHQNKKSDNFESHDEDKVMLGWSGADAASDAYHVQYDDPRFFGGMSQMTIDDFRAALKIGGRVTHRADANEAGFGRDLIERAISEVRRTLSKSEIDSLAQYFARATSQAQRVQLARQLTAALGTEVLTDEQHIPQVLEYFTHENATLIGSIPEELHQEIAKLTARAFTKRMNPDTFASLLEDRFKVAESKARFIARDQLGKLWGQVNAIRQRSVGVDQFRWRDCGLPNVRPKHRKASGQIYSYENPPKVGRDGEQLLPGEDYGCRCNAEPILDGIINAASALLTHRKPVR